MRLSNLSLSLTALYELGFPWRSLFADGTPGFRINVEEAIRLNKAAIGSKTSGFTPEELAACVAFQDSAGTLPVTAMEQPLGLILDTKLGVPVLGPELVTNGAFSDGATGWTLGAGWTVASGSASHSSAAGVGEIKTADPILTEGRWYVAEFVRLDDTGSAIDAVFGTSYVSVAAGAGRRRVIGRASGASTFGLQGGGTYQVANISVREIPGNHFVQPSNTASRPIVSRRVNYLTDTEQLVSTWNAVDCTVTQGAETFEGRPVALLTATSAETNRGYLVAALTPGATFAQYVFSVVAKRGTSRGVSLQPNVNVDGISAGIVASFNLETLETSASVYGGGKVAVESQSLTPLGDGYYRCQLVYTITGTTLSTNRVWILPYLQGDAAPASAYVTRVDLRLAIDANLPPYQRVTSSTDYDEVGFPAYAKFDGLDDWLETGGTVDMTSTDEVTVIAGVTKLSDAAASIILEYSASIAVNDGAFYLSGTVNQSDTGYRFASKGTIGVVLSSTAAPAPLKMLVSGAADISTPISTLRRDGVAVATTSDSQGTGNYGNHKFYMGRRGGTSFPFNGRVYGITVIGKLLPDNQLAAAEHAERQLGRLY